MHKVKSPPAQPLVCTPALTEPEPKQSETQTALLEGGVQRAKTKRRGRHVPQRDCFKTKYEVVEVKYRSYIKARFTHAILRDLQQHA